MALTTLNNDEICVIFGKFNKFEEFSGLVYSCKRMSKLWKDNKAKLDILIEVKTNIKNLQLWSTIGPKRIEIRAEKLNAEEMDMTVIIGQWGQSYPMYRFNGLFQYQVQITGDLNADDMKLLREIYIRNVDEEHRQLMLLTKDEIENGRSFGKKHTRSCFPMPQTEKEAELLDGRKISLLTWAQIDLYNYVDEPGSLGY